MVWNENEITRIYRSYYSKCCPPGVGSRCWNALLDNNNNNIDAHKQSTSLNSGASALIHFGYFYKGIQILAYQPITVEEFDVPWKMLRFSAFGQIFKYLTESGVAKSSSFFVRHTAYWGHRFIRSRKLAWLQFTNYSTEYCTCVSFRH